MGFIEDGIKIYVWSRDKFRSNYNDPASFISIMAVKYQLQNQFVKSNGQKLVKIRHKKSGLKDDGENSNWSIEVDNSNNTNWVNYKVNT